jgi:hypothetical protein
MPGAVYDLAMRLGVKPDDQRDRVRLTQTGRMKQRLDAPSWMPFTATQTISTRICEFDWRAKTGPLGMISVRDALESGVGHLEIAAFGVIPIARSKSTATLVRGELMRYLAELAWAPAALLLNPTLCWRDDGRGTFAVSAGEGDTASEVFLSLDGDGRIAAMFAPDRPRSVAASFVLTPWHGRFFDYRRHNDVWIPFAGEVAWEIAGKNVIAWQGRLALWE